MLSLLRMNATVSTIIALDIIPDPENNQISIFKQEPNLNESSTMDEADIQVININEDELEIELGLDFGDYYDTDYDEYEEDENEIIQQLEAVDSNQCPGA
ncbi:unnamed protein product [Rotaria socialis]|uniref:Uncharacterized protein n=1 Tax=Rotaria socialis TaxID=392032 RepID=A0A818F2H0_9BILA|nr:unnamed protein product [Rotaria socialis]CAF3468481.1 unnamed protein product [Rotaria socialis]CAF4491847.1 unnamed protein product [Rotaria socialis]CAF4492279.1 unnamed protein product [Rotaria socialis]